MNFPKFEDINDASITYTWPNHANQPAPPVGAARDFVAREALTRQPTGILIELEPLGRRRRWGISWISDMLMSLNLLNWHEKGAMYLYPTQNNPDKYIVTWEERHLKTEFLPGGKYRFSATLIQQPIDSN